MKLYQYINVLVSLYHTFVSQTYPNTWSLVTMHTQTLQYLLAQKVVWRPTVYQKCQWLTSDNTINRYKTWSHIYRSCEVLLLHHKFFEPLSIPNWLPPYIPCYACVPAYYAVPRADAYTNDVNYATCCASCSTRSTACSCDAYAVIALCPCNLTLQLRAICPTLPQR